MATTSKLGLTLMDQGSLITAATMNTNLNKIDAALGNVGGGVKGVACFDARTTVYGTSSHSSKYVTWSIDTSNSYGTATVNGTYIVPPTGTKYVLLSFDAGIEAKKPTNSTISGNVALGVYPSSKATSWYSSPWTPNTNGYMIPWAPVAFVYTNGYNFRVMMTAFHHSNTDYGILNLLTMTALFM